MAVEIQKLINLPDVSQETKEEIGNMLVNEILRYTSTGKSPVEGESFKKLNPKYADKEHKGDTTPRLRLEGDLMESLNYEVTDSGVIIGIMEDSQQAKADGHNNFSGDSKLPQRRFIPDKDQNFRKEIQSKIDDIVSRDTQRIQSRVDITDLVGSSVGVNVTQDLFGLNGIESIIEGLF